MERLSIQGDFYDCQLYGGLLYLWTFEGSLQVYNYKKILSKWLNMIQPLEKPLDSINRYENYASRYCLSDVELRHCLLYEQPYLTSEFPNGIEIIDGQLFEANLLGLFSCHIPLFGKLYGKKHLWDAPLLSINGARKRGLICSAGSDGLFWLPPTTDHPIFKQFSNRQSISSYFCSPGVYSNSSDGDSTLFLRNKSNYFDTPLTDKDLFSSSINAYHGKYLTWSWKNLFFIAKEHSLQVFEYVEINQSLLFKDEKKFWGWKGDFVSAGSSDCGTIVELDNAICLFENWKNDNGGRTIMGPVTRWRFYPRSKEYSNHIHVIFDDRMDIVVMNGSITKSRLTQQFGKRFY